MPTLLYVRLKSNLDYSTVLTTWDALLTQVRYDVKRGFFIQGLLEVEIRGLHDIMAVVDEGNGNRKVSSHLLNKDSSRSHSLLTVYLESDKKDPEDGHLVKQFGKVWLGSHFTTFRIPHSPTTLPTRTKTKRRI